MLPYDMETVPLHYTEWNRLNCNNIMQNKLMQFKAARTAAQFALVTECICMHA